MASNIFIGVVLVFFAYMILLALCTSSEYLMKELNEMKECIDDGWTKLDQKIWEATIFGKLDKEMLGNK